MAPTSKPTLRLLCLIMAVIMSVGCASIEKGRLVSTEWRTNPNKVVGYKYELRKEKFPSLREPVLHFKLIKYPIYEDQRIEKYEKIQITYKDPEKSISDFCVGIFGGALVGGFTGACLNLVLWSKDIGNTSISDEEFEKKVNATVYVSAAIGSIIGIIYSTKKNASEKVRKNIGQIEDIKDSHPSNPSFISFPAVGNIIKFSCDVNGELKAYKSTTNSEGIVKVDLLKDLNISKCQSETGQLRIGIEFDNRESGKIETQEDVLDLMTWLQPYSMSLNKSTADIYEDKSYSSRLIGSVSTPEQLLVDQISSNWVHVKYIDKEGWIPPGSGRILFVEPEFVDVKNPPNLETSLKFDDSQSEQPDGILAGNEKAFLHVAISNQQGRGRANRVRLIATTSNKQIEVEGEHIVGPINPGEVKDINIPLRAELNAVDGVANIIVRTVDDASGNEAIPIQLPIPVRAIPLPDLTIAKYEVNDGTRGHAQGNGNGLIENGETVELLILIENKGQGEAQDVHVNMDLNESEIQVIKKDERIARLNSKKSDKAVFIFFVPRNFNKATVNPRFSIKEGRGACDYAKNLLLDIHLVKPQLTMTYNIIDDSRISPKSRGNGDSKIQINEWIELVLNIKNEGDLEARDVRVDIRDGVLPGVNIIDKKEIIGTIPARNGALPGESKASILLNVKGTAKVGSYSFPITIYQKDFPKLEKSISLEINEGSYKTENFFNPPIPIPSIEPLIWISFPDDGTTTTESEITIIGRAKDDKAIEKIELRLNDLIYENPSDFKVIPTNKSSKDSLEFQFNVPLKIGRNTVKVTAIDNDELSAFSEISIYRTDVRSEIWVVAIGINSYANDKIPDLKYAVNDAREFADYFKEYMDIPPEHITTLLDDQATLVRIKALIGSELPRKVKNEDTVIIYFAGHGSKEESIASPDGDGFEKYLLPFDANPDLLYPTAFPINDIQDILRRIISKKLILMVDTCFSGSVKYGGRTLSFPFRGTISDKYLERLIAGGQGRIILTASAPNELSSEDDRFQHGIFTYFLLDGLKGKADRDNNGLISIDELAQYVKKEVSNATNEAQHPAIRGEWIGEIIVGRAMGRK